MPAGAFSGAFSGAFARTFSGASRNAYATSSSA